MVSIFKLKKKGVSPLIATILLVAVSLSLAGILYSWASQNAGDTVTSVTETSKQWRECSAINLYLEQGCIYDADGGLSFVLHDSSTVNIDGNINITVIDANNTIASTSIAPAFSGRAMGIDSSTFTNAEDFEDLTLPIRLRVFVDGCPDRAASTNSCASN